MNKRILALSALSLLVLGGLATCMPFAASLSPSARASAALPRIDVSQLQRGATLLVDHPTYGALHSGYAWGIFIYRAHDGALQAWMVPVKEGAIGMPDFKWWQPIYACQQFAPTADPTPVFKCRDPAMPEWRGPQWQWGLDGRHSGGTMADMISIAGRQEGGFYVVGNVKRR
jgi:hypothetical protein